MNKLILFAVVSTVIFAILFPMIMGSMSGATMGAGAIFAASAIYFVVVLVVGKFSAKKSGPRG